MIPSVEQATLFSQCAFRLICTLAFAGQIALQRGDAFGNALVELASVRAGAAQHGDKGKAGRGEGEGDEDIEDDGWGHPCDSNRGRIIAGMTGIRPWATIRHWDGDTRLR